jgi:hypothetical protein
MDNKRKATGSAGAETPDDDRAAKRRKVPGVSRPSSFLPCWIAAFSGT